MGRFKPRCRKGGGGCFFQMTMRQYFFDKQAMQDRGRNSRDAELVMGWVVFPVSAAGSCFFIDL